MKNQIFLLLPSLQLIDYVLSYIWMYRVHAHYEFVVDTHACLCCKFNYSLRLYSHALYLLWYLSNFVGLSYTHI